MLAVSLAGSPPLFLKIANEQFMDAACQPFRLTWDLTPPGTGCTMSLPDERGAGLRVNEGALHTPVGHEAGGGDGLAREAFAGPCAQG